MKQSKKIAQLKQTATEITNKQQLHQIKGGDGIGDDDYRNVIGSEDYRDRVIGEEDYRNRVIGTEDYRK